MGGLGLVADREGAHDAGLFIDPQHFADFGHAVAENAHERPHVLPHEPQDEGLGERHVGPRRQGAGGQGGLESAGLGDGPCAALPLGDPLLISDLFHGR